MTPNVRISLLVLACFAALFPTAAVARQPNIVFFMVDDMGWMDSTPYGSQYYDTPQMERFSKQSMRFTDAYAMPLCSPTRASIMSGKYSARHGVTSATGHMPPQPASAKLIADAGPANRALVYPESKNYLEATDYTLAEALRDAGYRTGHIGKWHLGLTQPHWPEQQGFQFALHGKPDPGPGSYFSPYNFRQYQSFPDGPPGEYITDRLTDEALKFIADNKDRPFFLNLWHYGVHGPWGHKEEYTKRYLNKTDPRGKQGNPLMASMLKSVDESLGRVLDRLDEMKLADDTIVVFYADNGGNTHSNTPEDRKQANIVAGHPRFAMLEDWRKWAGDQPPTNNYPLREGKGRLYEGGVRVPLMVRWPGKIASGSTNDTVVGPIDMYPTLLDLAGISQPPQQKIDGVSFGPVLLGKGKPDRETYFCWFPHQAPGVWVRQGDWKLIRRYEPTPDYPQGRELFNLRKDLSETKNLAAAMPDKVKELDTLIDNFLKETGALVPKPNPAYKSTAAPAAAATTTAKRAATVGGWVAQGCRAELKDGALIVTGENRSPFLAQAGLKLPGPVTVTLRTRGAGGPVKVQWRTAGQDKFPAEGQSAEGTLPKTDDSQTTRIELPTTGELVHLRIYLPAQSQPVTIDSIALAPSTGKAMLFEFNE